MEFPTRKLFKNHDVFEPLVWWENLFGKTFSSVRPFLSPCEDRMALRFPSPDHPSVQLTVRESGRKYLAFPPEELKNEVEDLVLDWEDVQVYHLDLAQLRTSIRKAFNLKPAAGRKRDGLFYIGRCEVNRECRPVYACLASTASEAQRAIELCDDPKKVGCVLFPTHYIRSERFLKELGISSVNLRESLSLKKDGFHGECPVNCANCLMPVHTQVESRLSIIEKTVLPDASRGSKTKRSASAGGTARAKPYLEKYKEARRYMLKYHRDNPLVSFTQVRRKAAQHVTLSESSLKNHLKKGDFIDW